MPTEWHVLIVHFNTGALTAELIATLPRSTPRGSAIRIHVLDNGSEQSHIETVERAIATRPGSQMLKGGNNIGFGAGVNALTRTVDMKPNDVVWILNPDVKVLQDCVAELERAIDSDEFDIVSPLILGGDLSSPRVWYGGGTFDARTATARHLFDGQRAEAVPNEPFPTTFVTGAAPLMRRRVWDDVGGYSEMYFLYWEDVEFSWNASRSGYNLGVVPSARIWHAAGGSTPGRGLSSTFYYWSTRNRLLCARRLGSSRPGLLLGAGMPETLRFIARAAIEPEDRITKVRASLRGTCSGLLSAAFSDDNHTVRQGGLPMRSDAHANRDYSLSTRRGLWIRSAKEYIRGFELLVAFLVGRVPNHRLRIAFYRHVLRMRIGSRTAVHWRTVFFAPERITIGENSIVGNDAFLDGRNGLHIGSNVSIAGHVQVYTMEHDPQSASFAVQGGPVVIGDRAYIGSRVLILPGVTVGEGAVIASGAVVTKNVEPYSIVAGVPAKPIGLRARDLTYVLNYHLPFQ